MGELLFFACFNFCSSVYVCFLLFCVSLLFCFCVCLLLVIMVLFLFYFGFFIQLLFWFLSYFLCFCVIFYYVFVVLFCVVLFCFSSFFLDFVSLFCYCFFIVICLFLFYLTFLFLFLFYYILLLSYFLQQYFAFGFSVWFCLTVQFLCSCVRFVSIFFQSKGEGVLFSTILKAKIQIYSWRLYLLHFLFEPLELKPLKCLRCCNS